MKDILLNRESSIFSPGVIEFVVASSVKTVLGSSSILPEFRFYDPAIISKFNSKALQCKNLSREYNLWFQEELESN